MEEQSQGQPSVFPHGRKRGVDVRAKSPSKLRSKVRQLQRQVDRLETRNADLEQRVQTMDCDARHSDKFQDDMEAALAEAHQKAVILERENRNFRGLLENLTSSITGKKQGTWVIGSHDDLPMDIKPHMILLDRVQEICRDRERLDAAAYGFAVMWARVPDSEKRRIIRECEQDGEGHRVEASIQYRAAKQEQARPKGQIVQFASPGDRF